jgi:hypothetical protein
MMKKGAGDDVVPKRAYLTALGRASWAMVNTYYAVLREREYLPDKIYIFTEEAYEEKLDKAIAAIKVLSSEYGINPEIESRVVSDWDFIEAGREISVLLKALKEEGYQVAIDITPGRKAIVVAALIIGIKVKIDYVFYLAIKTTVDAAKPYMMIPMQIQQIREFMEDSRRVVE